MDFCTYTTHTDMHRTKAVFFTHAWRHAHTQHTQTYTTTKTISLCAYRIFIMKSFTAHRCLHMHSTHERSNREENLVAPPGTVCLI